MSLFKVLPTVLLVILCGHCQLLQATKTNHVDLVILEFLISMKQSGDGIEFFIIPRNDGLQSHLDSATYESKSVPNRQLPQDCGDELFRCNPLVISQTDSEYYLLLVPIHGGLLIVELKHPTNSLKLEFGSHRVLESGDAVDCSPTMIFKVDNSYYTVCTNLRSKKITVYEIRLNGSVIEQVQLLGPLVREYLSGVLDVLSSSAVMNMSNFLLSLDDPHQPLIYFAIENYLFAIDLIDYAPLYSQIPSIGHGTSCQSVHRLVHASTNQLLAYCSTEYVYYSTEDELSHDEHSYTDSGVPYLCPNDTYTVSAFDNYLEYTIGSRSGTLTNVNVDMYSGMCFTGLRNISFFVYNDKVADKNVLVDLTSGGRKSILCKSMNCLPIIAVQDPVRYLVVRELSNDGRVNVLDVEKNFSVIISANHEASEMFAVLSVGAHKPPGPPRKDVISSHGAIVGGIMAGIVIFIVVVTTLVLILTYFVVKRIRLRHNEQVINPMPETPFAQATVDLLEGQPHQIQCRPDPAPIPVSNSGNKENFIYPGGTTTSLILLSDDEKRLYEEKNTGAAKPDLLCYEKSSTTLKSPPTNLNETSPINNDNDGNVLDNAVREPPSRDDHSEESDDNTMNSDEQCLLPQN